MDPQDIEANIKSLLGLNLGGGLPQVVPENGGPPPIRPPGSVGPSGLGPLLGPPGVIMPPMPEHQLLLDQGIAEPARGHPDAGGIITIESDSPIPSPRLSAQRSEKDLEDQLREEAAVEAIWQGPEEYKASQRTVEYLETRHLYPLKSKSAKFPRARWFCRLCEYHCDNLVSAASTTPTQGTAGWPGAKRCLINMMDKLSKSTVKCCHIQHRFRAAYFGI